MITIDLSEVPEFQALVASQKELYQLIVELQGQLPEWVDEQEAQRLTGLSATTLWRERKKPTSLIVWKSDHGVRYERVSLLAHNKRALVRHQA